MGAPPQSNARKTVLRYLLNVLIGLFSAYAAIAGHFSTAKGIGLAVGIGIILGLVRRTGLDIAATLLVVVGAHLAYLYVVGL